MILSAATRDTEGSAILSVFNCLRSGSDILHNGVQLFNSPTTRMRTPATLSVPLVLAVITSLFANSAAADSNSKVQRYIESSITMTSLPPITVPSLSSLETTVQLKAAQGSAWIKMSCSPQYVEKIAENPVPCWYGDPHGVRTIALYGDSNAGNWIPALDAVSKLLKYRLAVFAFPSCATPLIPEAKTASGYYPIPFKGVVEGPVWQQCADWHAAVGPAVAALNPSAVIAVSGPWMYSDSSADLNEWESGFAAAFAAMTKGHPRAKRIILGTSPLLPSDAPECLAQHPTDIQTCGESYKYGSGYYGGILERDVAVAEAAKATLIPTTPLFCYEDHCSPIINDYLVYVDQDHTTIDYTTYLEGLLYAALAPYLS